MALPPTSTNLLLHVLWTHLHVIWEIKDVIPVLVTDQGDPDPPQLIDMIQCQCKEQGKKCHI